MEITITLQRTDDWIERENLRTSENTNKDYLKVVKVSNLTEPSRQILLSASGGQYRSIGCLNYDKDYRIAITAGQGIEHFILDAIEATTGQVDRAIFDAYRRIELRKEKAFGAKVAEAKIAEDLATARVLLAEELDALRKHRGHAEEAAAEIEKQRNILSEFLSGVPKEVKLDAVSKVPNPSGKSKQEVMQIIEDASPKKWVFGTVEIRNAA